MSGADNQAMLSWLLGLLQRRPCHRGMRLTEIALLVERLGGFDGIGLADGNRAELVSQLRIVIEQRFDARPIVRGTDCLLYTSPSPRD